MKITSQCVVSLTWTLKDTLGEVLDELEEPIEFLIGGHDLLAKIEEALQGHEAGDRADLHLEPEDAFGEYDERLVFLEPRAAFPPDLEEGMTFDGMALPPSSSIDRPQDKIFTVTDIYPEHVVIDGNHPLAGIALRLSLRVEAVREAGEAEIGLGTLGTGFFKLESASGGNQTLH
jgi:FKBP-type peptidyl-prolyl cis-trans isomerase SlyD